jgi:hypothetical protein
MYPNLENIAQLARTQELTKTHKRRGTGEEEPNKTNTNKNLYLEPRILEDNLLYFKHKQDLVLTKDILHSTVMILYTADLNSRVRKLD